MTLTPSRTQGLPGFVPPSHASLFGRACAALFGPLWKSAAARMLGVSEKTVHRWEAREHPIPLGVYQELRDLVRTRLEELEAVKDDLAELVGEEPD